MSELEQLRKEVNELRERLAKLEDRGMVYGRPQPSVPHWPSLFVAPPEPRKVPGMADVFPPGTIIG